MARTQGFDIQCDQLESGRLKGIVDFASTENAQFYRDYFDREICNHGAIPQGMAAFTFPTTSDECANFMGETVTAQTLCSITRGDQYSYRAPANHGIFGCCFTTLRMDAALRALHHISFSEVLARTQSMQIPLPAMTGLRLNMQSAFASPSSPGSVLDREACGQAVEENLLEMLCRILMAAGIPASKNLAFRNHWRCVRHAIDYIEAHLGGKLRMETLCRYTGASERTLETAFKKVTGRRPCHFIRIRRLNAARHTLLRSRPEEISVKAVALGCGFWHMGNFTHDYFSFFGTRPSADLRARKAMEP